MSRCCEQTLLVEQRRESDHAQPAASMAQKFATISGTGGLHPAMLHGGCLSREGSSEVQPNMVHAVAQCAPSLGMGAPEMGLAPA